ncbi:MAG TPA: NADH-quinone oxidoreductase subunit C [Bacteroidia bacterium]|nr:NADH-quinone oxidoreductase subunit C [Bacteroidia bacterium]
MVQLNAQEVADRLQAKFGNKIRHVEEPHGFLTITVAREAVKDIIQWLYDEPTLEFRFLTNCNGMHFPDGTEKFGMVYHLHSLTNNFRLRLKTFTNEDPPVFPSLTPIFKAANWMERETYDFFGFKFTGHPDLRRILNMDNLEGWPLRKEFPLEDPFRKDKDDAMFGR